MAERARRTSLVVVSAAAAVLAGCEPVPGSSASVGDVLAGTWSACFNAGAGATDSSKTIVFYPDASYLEITRTFATTDRTCGGAATTEKYQPWSYRLGNGVAAYIGAGGSPVTAREINSWTSLVTVYSIVYQDTHATPPLLYFGDLALDPALDGTAATKRPFVLSPAPAYTSQ